MNWRSSLIRLLLHFPLISFQQFITYTFNLLKIIGLCKYTPRDKAQSHLVVVSLLGPNKQLYVIYTAVLHETICKYRTLAHLEWTGVQVSLLFLLENHVWWLGIWCYFIFTYKIYVQLPVNVKSITSSFLSLGILGLNLSAIT